MPVCGCTPDQPSCEHGKWLMMAIATGCQFIESPSFLTLPQCERDAYWVEYHQAVREYLVHCGYVLGTEGSGMNASEY